MPKKKQKGKGQRRVGYFNLICKNRFNVFSECTLNSGKDSGNSISVDSVSVFTMPNDSDNDSINDEEKDSISNKTSIELSNVVPFFPRNKKCLKVAHIILTAFGINFLLSLIYYYALC